MDRIVVNLAEQKVSGGRWKGEEGIAILLRREGVEPVIRRVVNAARQRVLLAHLLGPGAPVRLARGAAGRCAEAEQTDGDHPSHERHTSPPAPIAEAQPS